MGDDAIQIDRSSGLPVSSVDLLRRRIVNVVGHELRTPTTTVRGLAEAAHATTDEGERTLLLDVLVRASRRLELLVEELLLASSVDTVRPVGRAAPVDLPALATVVWTSVYRPGPLDVSGKAIAHAHEASVRRALDKVLGNAATLGAAPYALDAREVDGFAEVAVSSGGPTLRPDELQLAPEAFFRGEAAVTRAPGLGLGLAVARALLRGQGGDVDIAGRVGGGVATTIRLPAAG